MEGFFNKLLRIDLKSKSIKEETIPDDVFENYFGGKGLGTYLLMRMNPRGVDPLSNGNHLIFTTGCCTSTRVYGSCRYGVFTKSPLTGLYAESYSGGKVAEPMTRTGYDAIVLENASDDPVFLEISDKFVKFHDGKDLWGADTYKTEISVLKRVNAKGAGALVIGPAGENRVRFALIENDFWRSAGRTGVGAVMGAKKVKALVFHGSKEKKISDERSLNKFVRSMYERTKDSSPAVNNRKFGTPTLVSILNKLEAFPSRYWYEGTIEGWERITAESLLERCDVKPKACLKCFMACGNLSRVLQGRHKGLKIEGPEYETIFAFGGLCVINEIEEIIYLNDICDRLGLDTITGGSLCAFAIEASKRGIINERIDYGDVDSIAELLHKIARRDGIGDVLADGIKQVSRQWGLEAVAMHVKGLDLPGYDPRALKGMGLAYAVSPRGACHLRTTFYKPELSGIIDPDQIEGKAKLLIEYEDKLTLMDCFILCRFFRDLYSLEDFSYIITAITGLRLNEDNLREVATRITNLTRAFNLQEGMEPQDDCLPERLFNEKLGSKGKTITRKDFSRLLKDYYSLRGWN